MEPWLWSLLLLVLGLGIIVIEMFVPSGGVLGVIAAMCVVAAIVVAFVSSFKFGVAVLLVSSVAVPALLALMIQVWPNTPLGRRILIQPPAHEDEVLPDTAGFRGLRDLIGKRGVAKSVMMPSGAVLIEGRTYDAVGEGTAIESGQTVQVIAVNMNRLEVRQVDRTESPLPPTAPLKSLTSGTADELLSRPIESLGLESLDDPLT